MEWDKKFTRAAILSILITLLVFSGYCFWALHSPLKINDSITIEVSPGQGLFQVLRRLKNDDFIENNFVPAFYARLTKKSLGLTAGEYALKPGMSALMVVNHLLSGKVITYQIRLGEGWTLVQTLQAIANEPRIKHTLAFHDLTFTPEQNSTNKLSSWKETLIDELGVDTYPEGLIFPDTYVFTRGTTDIAIIKQSYEKQKQLLEREWQLRQKNLPFDKPADALILASMIEKEAGNTAEMPEIAGVFVRRLERGMRLQSDPTVIYGLGSQFNGDLTRANLLQDNPWNTYTRLGLPATPIAQASLKALHASLHPAEGTTLYFVARGDGTHYFSNTLEEHNQAVNLYQRKVTHSEESQSK
jgi:UPF0755 protein